MEVTAAIKSSNTNNTSSARIKKLGYHKQHLMTPCYSISRQKPQAKVEENQVLSIKSIIESLNDVPSFQRKDFRLGQCLGKGGFSKVYAITWIMKNVDKDLQRSNALSFSPGSKSTSSLSSKKTKFAMKVLRQRTLRKGPKHVLSAVTDNINEVQLLSLFKHENIINVHGFGHGLLSESASLTSSFKEMFLILDQLESTLSDKISNWQSELLLQQANSFVNDKFTIKSSSNKALLDRNIKTKIDIALQIASALQYLHDNGYIYRDLKPTNIGLNVTKKHDAVTGKVVDHFQVKIFDFGLCRKLPKPVNEVEKEDEINTIEQFYKLSLVGSREYMAPEVHNGQVYNCKADVYSWSLVFYTMLTLRAPYELYSAKEHKEFVCEYGERPSMNPYHTESYQIPSLLKTIIKDSWNQDIGDRPTMQQLATGLRWYYIHAYNGECQHNNKKSTSKTNNSDIEAKSETDGQQKIITRTDSATDEESIGSDPLSF